MTLDTLPLDLLSNDYFKAGTGLFGIALATAVLRKGAVLFQTFVRRNYSMTLEIPSNDKSYQWISPWVAKQTSATHLSVETAYHRSETGKIETQYQFIPSPGTHFFFYNGRIIKAERSRTQPTMAAQSGGTPFESLTLTTVGQNRELFKSILELAKQDALKEEQGWTVVYKAFGPDWRPFGYPRCRRPLSSVVLGAGVAELLTRDLAEFIDSQAWYRARGIPYRRGYLLHGPPGCGKSSVIAALAGQLEYSICVLSLGEIGMTGDRLDHLLAHAPLQSLVLLEDIDAAFLSRDDLLRKSPSAYAGMPSLSLSGLLNAVDGVSSTEGRILFMTTNHRDRLDPALVRPGRVDLALELGLCSEHQLKRMWHQFYPAASDTIGCNGANGGDGRASQFAVTLGPGRVSPAQVQGFLLRFKDRPDEALLHLDELAVPDSLTTAQQQ